jgi:hypothetical protein
MNRKFSWLLSVLCFGLFAAPSFAQCPDQHDRPCWNLQYILYAAETDFREFEPSKPLRSSDPKITAPNPDLSVGATHVPCRVDYWANAVAVYMCSAQMPAAEAEEWYAKTMGDLHELQYLWQYKEQSPGAAADFVHYVDAGPPGCDLAEVETVKYGTYHVEGPYIKQGPYQGQCPLHLQTVSMGDGTAKVSFWLNSYTSPNLAGNPGASKRRLPLEADSRVLRADSTESTKVDAPSAAPPAAKAPAEAAARDSSKPGAEDSSEPVATTRLACDDLCGGLKKILENRPSAFRGISATNGGGPNQASGAPVQSRSGSPGNNSSASAVVDTLVKLAGAASCLIKNAPMADSLSSARNLSASRARLAPVSAKGARAISAGSAETPDPPATQYVCYWPQNSDTGAESQFFDLVGLLQVMIPSSWSSEQRVEADEFSGAQRTVWAARDATNKAAIGVYLSGKSVGLHVASAAE